MEEKKITRKETYVAIIEYLKNQTLTEISVEEMVEFCQKQLELLDARAEQNRRAAAKRRAKDPLLARVASLLTEEYQTVADIILALEDNNVTASKVVARLNKLEKAGELEKANVSVKDEEGKARRVMGYRAVSSTALGD